ncbi:MAG: methylmalonyl Co-A mutase-associated GTPase MeaB [Anaerolineaceae bacterium]|nr:MAG: methylmalonyl Co-A mutase-associated GTPase MeaB [Anaerolineaceae bacterium]
MIDTIIQGVLSGQRRALARALTIVENGRAGMDDLLAALYPHTGRAAVIGVTGAPGSGKSSLVNAMIAAYRGRGQTVGVVAVDPTSPFSGGAILGDRIRMKQHAGDDGVFIRSMATRGSLGGLSQATRDSIRVLDAAGFDVVLVETVGAGQSEVDIVRTAGTTLVVTAPGMGDDVQAIKAGILEIADVLVVNKADQIGAGQAARTLNHMLELGHPASRLQLVDHHGVMERLPAPHPAPDADLWLPPVVQTVATESRGIVELLDAIDAHRAYLQSAGIAPHIEATRIQIELVDRLRESLTRRMIERIDAAEWGALVAAISSREMSPGQAVQRALSLYDKSTT